jgi:uncharacterized protein (TIGR02118 family)
MFMMFARFNFKSSDLAAEDRNYFENHVRLARQLPGVRMYLTGKLIETTHSKPDCYRAVVFGYDSPQEGLTSLDCPIGTELMADSAAHIVDTVTDAAQADVIVPLEGRRSGQPALFVVLLYNLGTPADELRRASYRTAITNLPRLCGYLSGSTFEARGQRPDRDRMEIRIFDPGALHGKSWRDLVALDQSMMRAPRVYCCHGQVQL